MKRKLIQHGKSSLTVSLPSKWVKERGLRKGHEVDVDVRKTELIISSGKAYQRKNVELDISGSSIMLRRIVASAFKAGYDEITINFSSHDELKRIQQMIREQFSGFEIISQTKNALVVKNVSLPSFDDFSNLLRRFFFVLNQMGADFCDAIDKNDFEWLKNTALMKIEIDRYADFCRRSINLGYESSYKHTAPLYTVIEQMEKVADRYVDMCAQISSAEIRVSPKVKAYARELLEFQRLFVKAFYEFELKKMNDLGNSKAKLQDNFIRLLAATDPKDWNVLVLLDRICNLIFDLNGPVMALNV
jgi:phosphate uptake regulator